MRAAMRLSRPPSPRRTRSSWASCGAATTPCASRRVTCACSSTARPDELHAGVHQFEQRCYDEVGVTIPSYEAFLANTTLRRGVHNFNGTMFSVSGRRVV